MECVCVNVFVTNANTDTWENTFLVDINKKDLYDSKQLKKATTRCCKNMIVAIGA